MTMALSGFLYMLCTVVGKRLAGLPLPLLCVLLLGINPSHPADQKGQGSKKHYVNGVGAVDG
jgi:hypothetical protein